VLYYFCSLANCSDGVRPLGGLVFDQAGNLYDTTSHGGSHGFGTVFSLTPHSDGSWTENAILNFTFLDGAQPTAGVVFDGAGNLYGTTSGGGANRSGVVFSLTPHPNGIWTRKVLYRFTGGKDGASPIAGVVLDSAGNLYGVTRAGGKSDSRCSGSCGVVFRLKKSATGTWKEQVLHAFSGKDGYWPLGNLAFDQAGSLFGTTWLGGNFNRCGGFGCGVVFELTLNSKGGWNETVLWRFAGNPGALPLAGVIFDAAGNLYGTTGGNDSNLLGSVFEITP
jgi:uncharacterized repeat protein (TIGR03803 family)